MTLQRGAATGQPASTPAALRAQLDALTASINDATAQRASIMARIDAASGPSERVLIRNNELRPLDGQIGRLNSQQTRLQADLRMAEANAANPSQPVARPPAQPRIAPAAPPNSNTTVPPVAGLDMSSMLAGGAITVLVLVPLFLLIVWRVGRRAALKSWRAEMREDSSRLAKVEEAVSSVVLEVERVSESQRFLANTLVGDTTRTAVKDKISTRI